MVREHPKKVGVLEHSSLHLPRLAVFSLLWVMPVPPQEEECGTEGALAQGDQMFSRQLLGSRFIYGLLRERDATVSSVEGKGVIFS